MNHKMNTDDYVEVNMKELRLRPGTVLKILDSKGKMLSHKAQFVAAFTEKSILISLLVNDTRKIEIRAGDNYLIRGFTGKYDFSFTACALQVDDAQFNARLSWPNSVAVKSVRSHTQLATQNSCRNSAEVKKVRNHHRARLSLPTTVLTTDINNPTPIVVKNLSAGGACIDSSEPLGIIGDKINLALPLEFEKENVDLNLTSIIRHITESDGVAALQTGIEFESASQKDQMILHYYVNILSSASALDRHNPSA